jgi:replicative DNA helicase
MLRPTSRLRGVRQEVRSMQEEKLAGRHAPHSEEAEKSVLGALMLAAERIPEVAELLQGDDFYNQRHRALYESLLRLADRSVDVDFISIGESLKAQGQFQAVGGNEYLLELAQQVTSAAHVLHHARIVSETAILRRLIRESTEIIEEAYATRPDGESVHKLLDDSEHKIYSIARSGKRETADPIGVILQEAMHVIDRQDNRGGLTGLSTGFMDMDKWLCGLNRGDLIVLAARPSMGKTALALNMIENIALSTLAGNDNTPRRPTVLLFSLEMSKNQLAQRLLCSRAQIDSHKLRRGTVEHRDLPDLARAADELSKSDLFIDDSPNLTVMSLRGRARRLKAQRGLDLIVVDYLQLMSHPKAESRQIEISAISRSLKALARELDVPVVALAQLSRQVEQRENHRPQLADLRESGSIEQDADVVMLLYRASYYPDLRNEDNKNKAEVIIAKHRNGPTGEVELIFRPEFMLFSDPAYTHTESVLS